MNAAVARGGSDEQRRAGVAAGRLRAEAGERALGGGAVVDGGEQHRLGAGGAAVEQRDGDLVAEPRPDVAGEVQAAGRGRQRHAERGDPLRTAEKRAASASRRASCVRESLVERCA